MNTAVDFHSHILPGIDDGSASVEESVAMLQVEEEQGIKQVVCTPHFYARHDNLERFLDRRKHAECTLRKEMAKHTGLPEIIVGAEVHFFTGISNSEAISNLTIGKTNYILIEMPYPPWTEDMYHELERIFTKRGLIPIIAHVDRYISRFRTFKIPQRLAELPVVVQANAEFFLNKSTASMAMRMLREEKVHLLGSDCHNLQSRAPNLGPAIDLITERLGSAAIARINQNEQKIFCNCKSVPLHTLV